MFYKAIKTMILFYPLALFCAQPHTDSIHIKAILDKSLKEHAIQAHFQMGTKTLTVAKLLKQSATEQNQYSYDDHYNSDEKHRKEHATHYEKLKNAITETETQAKQHCSGHTSYWYTHPQRGLVYLGSEGAADNSPRASH